MIQYTNQQTSTCSQSIINTLELSKYFTPFLKVSFVVAIGQVNVSWEYIWWKKRKPQLSGNQYKSC